VTEQSSSQIREPKNFAHLARPPWLRHHAAKDKVRSVPPVTCNAGAVLFTTKRGRVANASVLSTANVDRVDRSAPICIVRERSEDFPRLSITSTMRGMLFEIVPKIANAEAQMANKNKVDTITNIKPDPYFAPGILFS
jgi:hypothetical protein